MATQNRILLLENAFISALKTMTLANGYERDYFFMVNKEGEVLEFGASGDVQKNKNAIWLEFGKPEEAENQFVGMQGIKYTAQILVSPMCTSLNWRAIMASVRFDFIQLFNKNVDFNGTCASADFVDMTHSSTSQEARYKHLLINVSFIIYQERG